MHTLCALGGVVVKRKKIAMNNINISMNDDINMNNAHLNWNTLMAPCQLNLNTFKFSRIPSRYHSNSHTNQQQVRLTSKTRNSARNNGYRRDNDKYSQSDGDGDNTRSIYKFNTLAKPRSNTFVKVVDATLDNAELETKMNITYNDSAKSKSTGES